MDNYILNATREKRIQSRNHRKWRRHDSDHFARWIESISPEELNIFIGINGPNKIPRVKERIHFQAQPYMEIINRTDPESPPRFYPLGEKSALSIVGLIDFKQIVDKKRNLYKIVVFVIKNEATSICIEAPEGYEDRLPLRKRPVAYPVAGAKYSMLYAVPHPQNGPQGVISKIHNSKNTTDQYIPHFYRS